MKKIFSLVLAGIFFFSSRVWAADTFVEGMEDIPVPNQMMQISSENVSFGNEENRLVVAYLQANFMKFSFVAGFYEDTLPQLGWTFVSSQDNVLRFVRGNEELNIAMESRMPLIVRIALTGRP